MTAAPKSTRVKVRESSPGPPETRAVLVEATIAELTVTGRADISLRAVARRAGVSHAAPAYFFGDRAGLLTAAAATGFEELTARLHRAADTSDDDAVARYGQVYVEFALERTALFDLMFASLDLHAYDPDFVRARRAAIEALDTATRPDGGTGFRRRGTVIDATLVRWALAHGIAVLLRTGALQTAVDGSADPQQLAHRIIAAFTRELGT